MSSSCRELLPNKHFLVQVWSKLKRDLNFPPRKAPIDFEIREIPYFFVSRTKKDGR